MAGPGRVLPPLRRMNGQRDATELLCIRLCQSALRQVVGVSLPWPRPRSAGPVLLWLVAGLVRRLQAAGAA